MRNSLNPGLISTRPATVLLGAAALVAVIGLASVPASAYQTGEDGGWDGTTGADGSATMTLPGGVDVTVSVDMEVQADGLSSLNQAASADGINAQQDQFDPAVPVDESRWITITDTPEDCDANLGQSPADICEPDPRGTLTIEFNRPVLNPVIHVAGIGGSDGSRAQLRLQSIVPDGELGEPSSGANNLTNGGDGTLRIGTATTPVDESCTSNAGCGSVPVEGTVSEIVFDIRRALGETNENNDGFRMAFSVDEDFSNAPESYGNASHILSDIFLGTEATPNGERGQ